MKKWLLTAIAGLFTISNIWSEDQANFSAAMINHGWICEMQTGNLKVQILKSYLNFSVITSEGENRFEAIAGTTAKAEEFTLAIDEPDRKVLRRQDALCESNKANKQLVVEYEIRKGLPLLFVRSKLYNRNKAEPCRCSFSWVLPFKSPFLSSAGGEVDRSEQVYSRLSNSRDWLYSNLPSQQHGLGIVSAELGNKCIIQSNFSQAQWEKNKDKGVWLLSGGLDMCDPGKYTEINFVVFLAGSKEDVAKKFKSLNDNIELDALWKYNR